MATVCDTGAVNHGSRHVNDPLPVDFMRAHVSWAAVARETGNRPWSTGELPCKRLLDSAALLF